MGWLHAQITESRPLDPEFLREVLALRADDRAPRAERRRQTAEARRQIAEARRAMQRAADEDRAMEGRPYEVEVPTYEMIEGPRGRVAVLVGSDRWGRRTTAEEDEQRRMRGRSKVGLTPSRKTIRQRAPRAASARRPRARSVLSRAAAANAPPDGEDGEASGIDTGPVDGRALHLRGVERKLIEVSS